MFPTQISTFKEYVKFIERMLGSEVQGDIELTMDNFKDIISLSMKEFYRYYQAESLKTRTYVIEILNGKEEYKMDDLLIYKRVSTFNDYKLVPVQPEIFQVTDMSQFNTGIGMIGMGGGTDVNAHMMYFFNGNAGDGMQGMERAQMALNTMRDADYMKKLFQKKYGASFDRFDNTLKITPTPKKDGFTAITVAEYRGFSELINNEIFWKLTIANAKKQWSTNFMKYDDISIDGGGKTDFKSIKAEGKEEYAEIRQEMEDMRVPLMPFVD